MTNHHVDLGRGQRRVTCGEAWSVEIRIGEGTGRPATHRLVRLVREHAGHLRQIRNYRGWRRARTRTHIHQPEHSLWVCEGHARKDRAPLRDAREEGPFLAQALDQGDNVLDEVPGSPAFRVESRLAMARPVKRHAAEAPTKVLELRPHEFLASKRSMREQYKRPISGLKAGVSNPVDH